MKKILLVAFTILSLNCYSQTLSNFADTLIIIDTAKIDTIPVLIPVLDTTHFFDVFNSTGRLVKHNADYTYNVPSGWYRVNIGLANPNIQWLEGFETFKAETTDGINFNVITVSHLNLLKQQISSPYIRVGVAINRDGFGFKTFQ